MRALLSGLPRGGLNVACEAVDRHVAGHGDRLAALGIGKGDRVFSLLGRVPELYIGALGTPKNGSVFSPLFSAFGPDPVKARMTIGEASAIATTEAFYRRRIEPWRNRLARLKHVLLTECTAGRPVGTIDLAEALARSSR